jgi:hypothetical protein
VKQVPAVAVRSVVSTAGLAGKAKVAFANQVLHHFGSAASDCGGPAVEKIVRGRRVETGNRFETG